MNNIDNKVKGIKGDELAISRAISKPIDELGTNLEDAGIAKDNVKSAENILSSLKEKALLLDHLKSKAPTNKEIETIKADLERTIKELEALNV